MNGFLLDENLPGAAHFPCGLPVVHARDIGAMATDTQIWRHATEHSLVIVTKDADFSDRILIAEPPPWVVHLRIGNMRLNDYTAFLDRIWPQVSALLPRHRLIRVFADRIESVC